MVSAIYTPGTPEVYLVAVASLAVAGAVSFGLLIPYSRFAVRFLARLDYRVVNIGTLIIIVAVLVLTTGFVGLLIAIPATAIGLIPSFFGTRRMNCLGVLLVPIILNMAGIGPDFARWLGLACGHYERHITFLSRHRCGDVRAGRRRERCAGIVSDHVGRTLRPVTGHARFQVRALL